MEWIRGIVNLLPFLVEHPPRGVAVVVGVVLFLWGVWPYFMKKPASAEPTGAGSVIMDRPVFNAPAQVGGQNNTMNVNLSAYFAEVKQEPYRQGDEYHVRIRFIPKAGRTWAPGTPVRFEIKLSRPCRWTVDRLAWMTESAPGMFAGALRGVSQGPTENTDVINYGVGEPPHPGKDVVFDVTCDGPFEVVSIAASPTGP